LWSFFWLTHHLRKDGIMKLLNVLEVTDILRCSRKTLQSKPWRQRMGLPVVRIGTRTLFKEEDVARVIESGREVLPTEEKGGGDAA
jgi:hypothetical protein